MTFLFSPVDQKPVDDLMSRLLIPELHVSTTHMAQWEFSCIVYCRSPAAPETLLFPGAFICSDKRQHTSYSVSTKPNLYVSISAQGQ